MNREEKDTDTIAIVTDTVTQGGARVAPIPGNNKNTGNLAKAGQPAAVQQPTHTPATPSNVPPRNVAPTEKSTAPVTGETYIAAVPAHKHAANKHTTATPPAVANTTRPVTADLATLPGNENVIAYQPPAQTTVTADIPPAATVKPTAARLTIINEPNKTIAYKELDTSEDDQSLYVGSLELNRNKVKGILKKAGRMLGARAKAVTEENL